MAQTGHPAATLLGLLDEYLVVCAEWEAYCIKTGSKGFKNKQEEEDTYRRVQLKYSLPLMEECKAHGFKYQLLMDIIPGCFKTSSEDRDEIFEDLETWATEKYLETV